MYAFVMALSGYAWYRHTRRRYIRGLVCHVWVGLALVVCRPVDWLVWSMGWGFGRSSHNPPKKLTLQTTQHRAQVGGVTYSRLRDRATEHPSMYNPRFNDPFY